MRTFAEILGNRVVELEAKLDTLQETLAVFKHTAKQDRAKNARLEEQNSHLNEERQVLQQELANCRQMNADLHAALLKAQQS